MAERPLVSSLPEEIEHSSSRLTYRLDFIAAFHSCFLWTLGALVVLIVWGTAADLKDRDPR